MKPVSRAFLSSSRNCSPMTGFFLETFHAERYRAHGITEDFVRDNQSPSRKGVLRGMHF
jgi:dTDP-4-dehydrorhamnose 3,5-epimerase-like enzyme